MDSSRFDDLTRSVNNHLTRRLLGQVTGGALAGLASLGVEHAATAARKRRTTGESNVRGKKAIMCVKGETVRVPKKKRKKYLARGATRGKCRVTPICTPVCTECGGPDGCGGTCPGCAAGTICVNGACQRCSFTCDESPEACGEALMTRMGMGGALYLCPGMYEGQFLPDMDVQIYGAGGDTDDPAVSTLLVAPEGSRVMAIIQAISVLLASVRVTGGEHPIEGGGILVNHDQAELLIQHSVITGNLAAEAPGIGGGIANRAGTVTITDSEISFNSAWADGGGIYNSGTGTITLDPTVNITRNTASTGTGAGIYRASGTVIVNGASVTQNEPAQDQCYGVTCP